jgi:hypothetical protein
VLTHLKYFNFSSLLVNFYRFHIFFIYSFNCCLLTCFLVCCELHQSKLALSKVVFKVVIVEHICVPNKLPQRFQPHQLEFLALKVEEPAFIGRQHNLHGIKIAPLALTWFWGHLFYESSYERVHHSVLGWT